MVKGEICGQLEIIFRKIVFFVTAKRMHFPENHFRNHFEVDSNAALSVILQCEWWKKKIVSLYVNDR